MAEDGSGGVIASSFEGTLMEPKAPPMESESRSEAVVVGKGVRVSSGVG